MCLRCTWWHIVVRSSVCRSNKVKKFVIVEIWLNGLGWTGQCLNCLIESFDCRALGYNLNRVVKNLVDQILEILGSIFHEFFWILVMSFKSNGIWGYKMPSHDSMTSWETFLSNYYAKNCTITRDLVQQYKTGRYSIPIDQFFNKSQLNSCKPKSK